MSRIRANKITNQLADGSPTVEKGLIISGVTTVTTLDLNGDLDVDGHLNADNVSIAGVVTATTFSGSGASLTNLPAAQLSGTAAAINGSNITNLNASNIASGTVPTARLGSGTANSSTFLRGDSTFQTVNTDLVSDTSPQLGGDLDTNSHHILLDDSHSVKWGNGTELEILHTGSSGYAAVHNSQGNFLIDTTGNFYVRDTSGSKTSILANPAGSTELYYNNEKRLYTDSDGVTIGQSTYAQLKIDGQVGDCILASSGAQIEFTRASSSNILCSNSAGLLNIYTGGQTTYPAIRVFATPDVTTGAKVGINTDTIGVDTQMSVMASPGKPALYSSYGLRIMPNGANSFNYPGHYISNASGVYVIHMTIPANNTWTQVAAGRYHGATVTCRVGDASSKRTIFANYDFTAPNYGVSHYNEIANNGNWNTGSASMRVSSAGTYDYSLEVQHNSYYNTNNTSSVYLIFNVC